MTAPNLLITGATGHLGFRTLVFALEAGYRVRVAVRKPELADKIKKASSIGPFVKSIEFVVVPDITAPDAYQEAIKGVEHVIHVASPIPGEPKHENPSWQELYYDPAHRGTLSILEAAKTEPRVRNVVITSSVGVLDFEKERTGPADLRPVPDSETPNKAANFGEAYVFSKVLAHDAATKFVQENQVGFKLVRVLPGYIQGPNEILEKDEQFFSASNEGTINAILGNVAPYPKPTSQVFLDDAAKAHVVALEDKVKDMEVLIIVGNDGQSVPWEEVALVAAKMFPKAFKSGALKPVKEQQNNLVAYDISSSEAALGFKFAGTEEMVRGLVQQYLEFHEIDY